MPLTALIKLGFKVQAAASLCVLILLLSIGTPIRLLVMLMVLFLKPSVLFVLFQRVEGLQKECTKSVLGNLLLTFFIVRPVLEAAGFCLFAPRYRSLGGFPKPQKWRKCIPISAALIP